jgi:2-keto-4-pentenoate hydratase/2-oxohepta-3-ene-1,7-dioic acid hydratase in catechol pathway
MAVKKYVRFEMDQHVAYGLVQEHEVVELAGSCFDPVAETGRIFEIDRVHLLAPCEPTKILAVGLNYKSHLGSRALPTEPGIFFKPVSAILDPEGTIVVPEGTAQCEFEGELVIVIGKTARCLEPAEAGNYIFGVTCGNDISARDWQKGDLQWWRAKGCDTFAPFGPMIVQGLNYNDLLLTSRLDGDIKQKQRTSDLIFGVHEIVSFASQYLTLCPGDIIYTGTPGATAPLTSGSTVEVELEGVGVLKNSVA